MTDVLADKINALADLFRALQEGEDLRAIGAETSLDRVQVLRMIRDTAESALRQAVPSAIGAGATWAEVGRMLDTSAQAAHQRYAQR